MNKFDVILLGAIGALAAVVVYEMYQFNKPKYMVAINAPEHEFASPGDDVYLIELLDRNLRAYPA